MPTNSAQKQIKIISCKDPLLWYAKHIGEVFNLIRVESGSKEYYWTREKDPPHYLNWVAERDAYILPVVTSDNQSSSSSQDHKESF